MRWPLAWLLLAVLMLGAGVAAEPAPRASAARSGPPVVEIGSAWFVKSDATELPPPSAPWQPQALPDSWRVSRPGQLGFGWYRATFTLAEPPRGVQAIYISLVNSAYTAYVNGVEVADSGGMEGNVRRSGGFPQWITVPPQSLHAGDNEFALRLRVSPNLRGGLTAPVFGPKEAVYPRYQHDVVWRSTVPQALSIALLALGALALLLWARHRSEAAYGWFGGFLIVSALWVLRNFNESWTPLEISSRAWETYVLAGHGVNRLMLVMFVLRYTGQRRPRLEHALLWAMPLLPVVLYAVGEAAVSELRTVLYTASGWPVWYSVYLLVRFSPWRLEPGARLLLATAVSSELLTLHDWFIAVDLLPFGTVQWQNYGPALLMMAMTVALASRYFAAFAIARSLNSKLELRAAQTKIELDANYRIMAGYERAATLEEERRRLMRDMHDGIGSQLITAANAVERGRLAAPQIASLLRDCIDDLRLVIDSLEPGNADLSLALASLRYRLAPRLRAAGLESQWELDRLPTGTALSPAQVLQVLRIVQEAFTNVIKHAGARHATLIAHADASAIEIRIVDDGHGQGPVQLPPCTGAERGLLNMRHRAGRIGGAVEVRFASTGTSVILKVPLNDRPPAEGAGGEAGTAARPFGPSPSQAG